MKILPTINPDKSQNTPYSYGDYKIFLGTEKLSDHPGMHMVEHWHPDLEFLSIIAGKMIFNVNGEIIQLQAGNGIFINSHQLHYAFSENGDDCEFIYLLFPPELISPTNQIFHRFIEPIVGNSAISFVHLESKYTWHNYILTSIKNVYDARDDVAAPLEIHGLLFNIWSTLYNNMNTIDKKIDSDSPQLSIMRKMLSFIQDNYAGKITLEDIAASGNVSRSTCSNIFKKYVNDSPVIYLIKFRILRSVELLENTDKSISEIAYDTGFWGMSYFSETFRKYNGCTPSEYRANLIKY